MYIELAERYNSRSRFMIEYSKVREEDMRCPQLLLWYSMRNGKAIAGGYFMFESIWLQRAMAESYCSSESQHNM